MRPLHVADLLRTNTKYMVHLLICRQQSEQAKVTGAGAPSKPVGCRCVGECGGLMTGCGGRTLGELSYCTMLQCIISRCTGDT